MDQLGRSGDWDKAARETDHVLETRTFGSDVVYLRYEAVGPAG